MKITIEFNEPRSEPFVRDDVETFGMQDQYLRLKSKGITLFINHNNIHSIMVEKG